MAIKFSDEQLLAINTTNKSVLVSAAAGSGKTSVLIERIIRIILDGKANVDEMLVVTFTNAAASEMRLRLSQAIRKSIAENPETAPRMKDQLSRLYRAYITTIDSFSLRVIREFFHMLDLEPGTSAADSIRTDMMQKEAAEELFEDGFADDAIIDGMGFREFLKKHSDERSEDRLMKSLIDSYSRLRTMPDYFEWAYAMAENLKVSAENFEGSHLQNMMTQDAKEVFASAIEGLRKVEKVFDSVGLKDVFESKLQVQLDAFMNIYESLKAKGIDASLMAAIEDIPSPSVRVSGEAKDAYESVKPEIKQIRETFKKAIDTFKGSYILPDFETRLKETSDTYEYTVYYLKLLEEFERRYEAKKRSAKLMDFADMEQYALKVLRNEDAAGILKKRFKFIFIDEYQDTNNIQESLIGSIARPDNVFRVGDEKQSIYRFRQAEPELFERLYKQYTEGNSDDELAVDLGLNFRTNDRTIKYINHVFKNLMESYDERAMLYTGTQCEAEYDFEPEIHLLTTENSEDELEENNSDEEFQNLAGYIDEEIEELSKEEAEAEYIAKLTDSIIGTEFYDTKKGVVRKAGPSDIAILFRNMKYRGEIMSRALRDYNIESHIEESEDFFDTTEIAVALSLLMVIDNMKRDIPLISALHSEVFGFTPSDLAKIRVEFAKENRGAFCDAFEWYTANGSDAELKENCNKSKSRILEWRALSRMMPLDEFVWKVLVDSGYYRMAGAMSEGARRQANLRALADRAASLSKDSVTSLSSFINFIEIMKSKEISKGQTSMAGPGDDVVRISTIHKSKGLEYPFVIVGGLGHRIRYDSNEKAFSFDSSAGIGLPYIDPNGKYWRSTQIQRGINSKSKRDTYKEELRLLYVAMTRARNKLHMVATIKSEEDLNKYETRPSSYIKAMKDVIKTVHNRYRIEPMKLTKAQSRASSKLNIQKLREGSLNDNEQAMYDELARRLEYTYPYEDLLSAKAKYSVSEIRRAELAAEDEEGDNNPVDLHRNVEKKKKASAADIGIAYHRIMEFLDFEKASPKEGEADKAYIEERANFLRENDAISGDVFEALDLEKICAFFKSDIGRRAVRAAKAGKLRREKPFTLQTEREGRSILVQGIIDCCFEENGSMVVLDYKSSYIDKAKDRAEELNRIKDEYKVQIDLYSQAVQKGSGMEVSEAYLYLFDTGEAISLK